VKKYAVIVSLLSLTVLWLWACRGGTVADKILIQGRIWTGNPGQSWAEAVALRAGRILAVGKDKEIKKTAGNETEVIDLNGRLGLPGFIDSHVHFLNGGFSLMSIQLRDAASKEDFISRIAAKAKSLAKGEWILNGDWDHTQFSPPELPRREWIDGVTPDNPVCINRLDGHMILANSLALKMGGVTKNTPLPPGGEIVKDPASGEPTGILKDAAMDLVYNKIPVPTLDQTLKAARAAMQLAAELGVTSVHDMSDPSSFEVYQELLKNGRLTVRLHVYVPVTEVEVMSELKLKSPFGNEDLKLAGLKGFADGSLGSATAYFFDPYADDPKTRGLLHGQMFPEGIMEKRVLVAARAGLQVAIHAIGDRANAVILDIYEKAAGQQDPRDRRFRIEHAQHLRTSDIARFGRLGVIASMQPYHAVDDGRWAETKIGPDRVRTTYAFKSLLENGAVLAFGSDWPVAPLDPIQGIYAAVTRRTIDGKNPNGWVPEQKISLEDALKGYTSAGAFAEFAEKTKGTIEPGKLADIVVLDKNLFAIPPEEIRMAKIEMTILGGRIVYKRD
jgi:predicted amidohydrolase YtcJ